MKWVRCSLTNIYWTLKHVFHAPWDSVASHIRSRKDSMCWKQLTAGAVLKMKWSYNILVFCRKDHCEARPKMQSVFKFSDNLSALSQMDPHRWGFGSGWCFCQIFRSGWCLVRWTPVGEALGQVDILSDLQVRLTFGHMDPQAETSCGQGCYYFG